MPEPVELLIVGAGPAGVSAALWARSLGIEARVLERADRVGGQLHLVLFHPTELPGVPDGDGPTIAAACARQLREAEIEVVSGFDARELRRASDGTWEVASAAGDVHAARAVVIATGLRRRRLGVPGERELEGRGVSYSARRDRDTFAGARVAVIGGGDGAYENALLLTEVGCTVELLLRGHARARDEFRARVAADPRIRVHEEARVVAFEGADRLERVRVARGGRVEALDVRGAVIKIGMIPNAEWCGEVPRDSQGFVRVDAGQRTERDGVWAVGDVAGPARASIAAAIGSASTALAGVRSALRGG